MNKPLSRLEKRVEQLIEGAFARLFAGRVHPHEVAVQLSRAMEDHLVARGEGEWIAPDHFRVRLNPDDAGALLEADPALAQKLAKELLPLAREAGLTLLRPPVIDLLADAHVPLRGILVEAAHGNASSDTVSFTPVDRPSSASPEAPNNAFLIVDGGRHYPLDRPVVSIGRRLDNHIVLENPKVSRTHAQLRLRHGRYVLYDLGSSGGTQVNGETVKERVLEAGDVISLPGASLIYGEEERVAVEAEMHRTSLEEPTAPLTLGGPGR